MRQRYIFEDSSQRNGIAFEGDTRTGEAKIHATVAGDAFYVIRMEPENLRKLAAGIVGLADMLDPPPPLPLATFRSSIQQCGTTGF